VEPETAECKEIVRWTILTKERVGALAFDDRRCNEKNHLLVVFRVEPGRIELPSKQAITRFSTCLVSDWFSMHA